MDIQHSKELTKLWIYLMCLGFVLPNYPFIHIFSKVQQLWGIPIFPLFLWGSWLITILIIYLFSRKVVFK
jgi:hypothetical protein